MDYTAPPSSLLADSTVYGVNTNLTFQTPIINDEFVETPDEFFAVSIALGPGTENLRVSIAPGRDMVIGDILDDDST